LLLLAWTLLGQAPVPAGIVSGRVAAAELPDSVGIRDAFRANAPTTRTAIAVDGTFRFSGIAPGTYVLQLGQTDRLHCALPLERLAAIFASCCRGRLLLEFASLGRSRVSPHLKQTSRH
jgi:hypothetical protein